MITIPESEEYFRVAEDFKKLKFTEECGPFLFPSMER
jgi:hypothetical protein